MSANALSPSQPAPNADAQITPTAWLALVSLTFGSLMASLDATIMAVANAQLARQLGATLDGLQWVSNAYLLALAASMILAGKLGDRFGRKRMFLVGVVGFALSSLAIGLADSVGQVIGARASQGVFGALITVSSLSLIRVLFPPEKLATGVGIFSAVQGLSVALGPVLGGAIVEHFSWRVAFFINVPLGVFCLAVGLFLLVESRLVTRAKFDFAGVILLTGTLLAITYATIEAPIVGWAARSTEILCGAGIALLVALLVVERRAADPLIPLSMFRDRSVSAGAALSVLVFFGMNGALFFIVLYLQQVLHISPMGAGARVVPFGLALLVAAASSGPIISRVGCRVVLVVGSLLMSAGLYIGTFTQIDGPQYVVTALLLVLGFGLGLLIPASTDATIGNAPIELAGAAAGVQSTANRLGGVMGVSVLGAVMAAFTATAFRAGLNNAAIAPDLITRLTAKAGSVALGIAPIEGGMSPQIADLVRQSTASAFVTGMHAAMGFGAVICLSGALVSLLVRPQAFRPNQRAAMD